MQTIIEIEVAHADGDIYTVETTVTTEQVPTGGELPEFRQTVQVNWAQVDRGTRVVQLSEETVRAEVPDLDQRVLDKLADQDEMAAEARYG